MAERISGVMREVVVAQPLPTRWKEIVVCTGASVSTLQDIKVPDSCGGYTYRDSGLQGSPVRNRFIYWRTSGDVLELEESSLDMTLTGGCVRYRMQDTPIVGGVSITESNGHVIVLVATVASVHRLVFPQPCRSRPQDGGFVLSDHISTSIFYDASLSTAMDSKNMHMLTPGGSTTTHLLSATSCVNNEGEAIFALATNAGSIILLKLPPLGITGVVIQHELSQSSVMQKLWSGLVPGVIRGNQQASDTAVSMVMQSIHGEIYIFALCRDLRLRVWATKTRECVLTVNLVDMIGEPPQPTNTATTGHIIKRVQSPNIGALDLCVYLSFPDRSQFVLMEPVAEDGRIHMQRRAVLSQPAEDLIDFCVTADQLVTLWTGSAGETIARSACLTEAGFTGRWNELLLEVPDADEPLIPQNRDPRDLYLELIFNRKDFSKQEIIRALSVFRRSQDTVSHLDTVLFTNDLKEEVITAVENKIRDNASDYEMQEDAYYQLQRQQWAHFYSCCCQYREVGAKPQGAFADSVTGLVCLIRKASISYLRPCELLERLYLCEGEKLMPEELNDLQFGIEGVSPYMVCEEIYKICRIVQLIRSEISDDIAAQFLQNLRMLESPVALAEKIVDVLFFENADLESEVGEVVKMRLQDVRNLLESLDLLQRLLDLQDIADAQSFMDDSAADAGRQLNYSRLFTSTEASAIISRSFEQVCLTRLSFLRDLIVLQVLSLRLGRRYAAGAGPSQNQQQELLQAYSHLVRGYSMLYWTTQAMTITCTTAALDSNIRRLASLDLRDSGGFSVTCPAAIPLSILESFVRGIGGTRARQQVAMIQDEDSQATWSHDLMALVQTLASLVWPLSDETVFPEFLAGTCQYLALQEYVRQLRPWCTWNDAAVMFFLGLSYLHFDEAQKARLCFISAREGIAMETFLADRLLHGEEAPHSQLTIQFYLKVIKLFEEYGMPDIVISLASEAIRQADADDPNLATLQAKAFKYQLELGHNQEAYAAMMANPDPSRRKDCLRQLLVVLCERGELQTLVEFPYKDMQEEVEMVLEKRARSVDLATHNYYDLLYAFHIYRNNFRKAASIMYEHGLRYGQEIPGVKGLQRQAQCYLAAMNALRLVKPEYSWIVRPVLCTKDTLLPADTDSPHTHSTDARAKQKSSDKQTVEILELTQLEKDYLLLDARLRLIHKHPDPSLMSGPTPGADEMVGILVNAGLYDLAVTVCCGFSLSLHTVFNSLALRCVSMSRVSTHFVLGDSNETADAWEWLRENDIRMSTACREGSASDHGWRLLQCYLERFEEPDARYHRCVAEKLLSQGFPLPAWLVNSFKVLSASQLLRVYLDYDLLQAAAQLLIEYLDSLMDVLQGQDAPAFGLKGLLHHGPMAVWVPYTCADQLLRALQQHQDDDFFIQMYKLVNEKILAYQNKISRLSGVS